MAREGRKGRTATALPDLPAGQAESVCPGKRASCDEEEEEEGGGGVKVRIRSAIGLPTLRARAALRLLGQESFIQLSCPM